MWCKHTVHTMALICCIIMRNVKATQTTIWAPNVLEPMYDKAQQQVVAAAASPTSLLVIQMMALRHERDVFVMGVKRYNQNLIKHLRENNCDDLLIWQEVQQADIHYSALPLTKYLPTMNRLTELITLLQNAIDFVMIETTILKAEQTSYSDDLVMFRIMVTTFTTYLEDLQRTYKSAIVESDTTRNLQMKSIIRKAKTMPEDIVNTINEWLE